MNSYTESLCSRIEKTLRTYSSGIGVTSMTIVKYGTIAPGTTDVGVGLVSAAPVVVGVILEEGLQLVLLHAGTNLTHHRAVGGSGHAGGEPQHLQLCLGLVHSAAKVGYLDYGYLCRR